jgi:hypothetical protein
MAHPADPVNSPSADRFPLAPSPFPFPVARLRSADSKCVEIVMERRALKKRVAAEFMTCA